MGPDAECLRAGSSVTERRGRNSTCRASTTPCRRTRRTVRYVSMEVARGSRRRPTAGSGSRGGRTVHLRQHDDLRFLLLRWYFRRSLVPVLCRLSRRIPLQINALHPDRAGGLGFLSASTFALQPLRSRTRSRWPVRSATRSGRWARLAPVQDGDHVLACLSDRARRCAVWLLRGPPVHRERNGLRRVRIVGSQYVASSVASGSKNGRRTTRR